MNIHQDMLERFLDGGNGINFFSTANNHALDYGWEGLEATWNVLKSKQEAYGLQYAGTNIDQAGQDDILIIEKNGIKIAMLAYTFDTNGMKIPADKKFCINEVRFNDEVCDISMVEEHVRKAKALGADIVIACCHWGWEFEMYPHKNVMEVGHRIIESGVNVILGNHPHVSQPMERYVYTQDNKEKAGFIIYSCGDFVSYHPESRNSKLSYIAKFDIVKGTLDGEAATAITNLKILPVYILNEKLEGDNNFNCRLLRFKDVLADYGASGSYEYNLPAKDRSQLPHLNEVVLHKILLPEQQDGLLAD